MALVLIVEDEEQVRVLAEPIIQDMGHETLTAGTADQARAGRTSGTTSISSSPTSACNRISKPACSLRRTSRNGGRSFRCSIRPARA
jgi:CheY-like chemotaxis protein